MRCRHCHCHLEQSFVDLGSAPPSNAYLTEKSLGAPEIWFPLKVMVCSACWLVQTQDYAQADELFGDDYAYFSSFSTTWIQHCEKYVGEVSSRYSLGPQSLVIEIAANDGALLQFFLKRGVPCVGIEPTASTARAARERGLEIVEKFFSEGLAKGLVEAGQSAHLIIANNVLAHVPDINDFVRGIALLLREDGVATFEFPSLLKLLEQAQFDTIYHEHYSYLSLHSVGAIFEKCGLQIFDVEQLETHGGSLRVHVQRKEFAPHSIDPSVASLLLIEAAEGLLSVDRYCSFQNRAEEVKNGLLEFLLRTRAEGKLVAGYGAAAKGNTLLNFAGVRGDLLGFVVDKNPAKVGKYLPGSRIPIVSEERLKEARPDYILVLPWNLKLEIMEQLQYVRGWGGLFVTAVPKLVID
jgi:SAM-dependent methyltransferase